MRGLRPLLVVSTLLLAAGCGTKADTPGAPATGEQARVSSLKDSCPAISKAFLATSPTAADQLQMLAATLDAISDDGNVKVKNALSSLPVDVRALAADTSSAQAATTYAADVADVAKACAANGSPFPVS
ncbi:MAG: hypothetical protein JWO46_774 [Nocardioidaceae bacterium]|nr:hypothetical protein [Nocardioidaceae bacterium]